MVFIFDYIFSCCYKKAPFWTYLTWMIIPFLRTSSFLKLPNNILYGRVKIGIELRRITFSFFLAMNYISGNWAGTTSKEKFDSMQRNLMRAFSPPPERRHCLISTAESPINLLFGFRFYANNLGLGKISTKATKDDLQRPCEKLFFATTFFLWRVHSHYMLQLSLAKLLLRLSCLSLFFFPSFAIWHSVLDHASKCQSVIFSGLEEFHNASKIFQGVLIQFSCVDSVNSPSLLPFGALQISNPCVRRIGNPINETVQIRVGQSSLGVTLH